MTRDRPQSTRRTALVALAGTLVALADTLVRSVAAQSEAQGLLTPEQGGLPIEIEAEAGIEWRRDDKLYIARGNATARRGDITVVADTLSARYRDGAGGGSEIWHIEADGHVRLMSPGRTITGGHAVYNLDQRVLQVTGGNLSVDTGEEKLTADESLEYRDGPQVAIARGNATVTQAERQVRADVMTGHFQRRADGELDLVRLEADGAVEVRTPDTYATSAKGQYDLTTEIMTLSGDVKVTNAGNQFNGEFAEVNVRTGVSRLLGSADGTGKVKSLIMPSSETSP